MDAAQAETGSAAGTPTPGAPTAPTAPGWVTEFYAAVDAGDGAGASARMAPDMQLQVAARPPVTGRAAAGETLAAFHTSFDRVSHAFRNVWNVGDDTVICEFVATYRLHDGRLLPLPTITVLRRGGEGIAEMRVYLDEGALRAAAGGHQ